ncbi:hypothetical protein Ahy_B07g087873 [Arachis hypogaea]|uniref:Uncharacterized protein n=1 Tax=Arachis hypogaea TaxID=3818 RepID=A0A444YD66_ARAHY|nr:hypothetical protein Ahy_B07g087873 [Arachis hypogaea]
MFNSIAYVINSGSDCKPAIVSGAKTTSKSTVPLPSLPGNAEIFPSNLFAPPLLTANGLPQPKSLSYIGNLGELPIVIDAPSGFPSGKHRGVVMSPNVLVELLRAPTQIVGEHVGGGGERRNALNRVSEVESRQFPCASDRTPQQRAYGLKRRNLDSCNRFCFSRALEPILEECRYLTVTLLNCFAAEAEDSLPNWRVGVERHLRPALWQSEDGLGDENAVAAEVRNIPDTLTGSSAFLSECVEEVPERGSVSDGMVDGNSDEKAVGELGYLNGHNRGVMTAVTNLSIEGEEFSERFMDVKGGKKIENIESGCGGVEEVDAGVVTGNIDITVGVSG